MSPLVASQTPEVQGSVVKLYYLFAPLPRFFIAALQHSVPHFVFALPPPSSFQKGLYLMASLWETVTVTFGSQVPRLAVGRRGPQWLE